MHTEARRDTPKHNEKSITPEIQYPMRDQFLEPFLDQLAICVCEGRFHGRPALLRTAANKSCNGLIGIGSLRPYQRSRVPWARGVWVPPLHISIRNAHFKCVVGGLRNALRI